MFINSELLISKGAILKKYKKGEFIFHEGEAPRFFYQIYSGTVKLFNSNNDGREFTQAEFKEGNSFGEPPLFIDENYPATAVATENSVITILNKEKFFEILEEQPKLALKLLTILSQRIFNKSITAREIVNNTPEVRILAFLDSYKKKEGSESDELEVPYTRQEIANYTGLRVETVIRTLSKMKTKKRVKIVNRKLYY